MNETVGQSNEAGKHTAEPWAIHSQPDGQPTYYHAEGGLTIRAHMATQCGSEAMAILNDYYGDDWKGSCLADAMRELAKAQVAHADALIAELNRTAPAEGGAE